MHSTKYDNEILLLSNRYVSPEYSLIWAVYVRPQRVWFLAVSFDQR